MSLSDLIGRTQSPEPWAEADNIPWHEPGFSERMLREHLNQSHDLASRRFEIIDQHVAWIDKDLLSGRPSAVLDLGCGPGFYSHRLARLGHRCRGIDYSPASLRYARRIAEEQGLCCEFLEQDLREGDWGAGYDLAMQIYGEFNVFRPEQAQALLERIARALAPGGRVLIEYQTWEGVRSATEPARSWEVNRRGVASDAPHAVLTERFWDEGSATHTARYHAIAEDGTVTTLGQTTQAHHEASLRQMVEQAGLVDVQLGGTMAKASDSDSSGFRTLIARRALD